MGTCRGVAVLVWRNCVPSLREPFVKSWAGRHLWPLRQCACIYLHFHARSRSPVLTPGMHAGAMFAAFTLVNMVIATTGSTMVVPASLYFFILVLWLAVGVPTGLLGGAIALRALLPTLPEPAETEPRPVPAPRRRERMSAGAGLLCAAGIPMFLMSTELWLAMDAAWRGFLYAQYGRFLVTLLAAVAASMALSIINTCAPSLAPLPDLHPYAA